MPPRLQDITVMFGSPKFNYLPPVERVRAIDRQRLEEVILILQDIPLSMIDRSGLDFWSLIRRLTWHVPPAPVRLLTQFKSDPFEVWSWNSKIQDKSRQRAQRDWS